MALLHRHMRSAHGRNYMGMCPSVYAERILSSYYDLGSPS